MKRKLLKQIFSERRANAWLVTELIIISAVLFWLTDYSLYLWRLRSIPMGVDTENVLEVNLTEYKKASPLRTEHDFGIETNEKGDTLSADDIEKQRISKRLSERDEVVAINSSYSNRRVYRYDFIGNSLANSDTTSAIRTIEYINFFTVEPNYFEVFIPKGLKGETSEKLTELLKNKKIVVTSNLASSSEGTTPEMLYNHPVVINGKNSEIGAVIAPVRRTEYEYPWHASVFIPERITDPNVLFVRVRPGTIDSFREYLKTLDKELRTNGNVHLGEVKDFRQLRDDLHRDDDARHRNAIIGMSFLLVTVFLGILGTFWFRTQERTREIAIRKVTGASAGEIFSRLFGEGFLLLSIATVFAVGLDCIMVWKDLTTLSQQYWTEEGLWIHSFAEMAGVYVTMTLMVAGGIWFPAMRAVRIDPADTLRSE